MSFTLPISFSMDCNSSSSSSGSSVVSIWISNEYVGLISYPCWPTSHAPFRNRPCSATYMGAVSYKELDLKIRISLLAESIWQAFSIISSLSPTLLPRATYAFRHRP